MHACMHAYIHTYIHACIHTYMHACITHWVDTWWANGDVSPSQMAEQKCDF